MHQNGWVSSSIMLHTPLSPSKCIFSQQSPRGVKVPHHWGGNSQMKIPLALDTWYIQAQLLLRNNEQGFDRVNISRPPCRVGIETNDRVSISANERTTGARDWRELTAPNRPTGQLLTRRQTNRHVWIHTASQDNVKIFTQQEGWLHVTISHTRKKRVVTFENTYGALFKGPIIKKGLWNGNQTPLWVKALLVR